MLVSSLPCLTSYTWGLKSSCALWKAFLKICHLSSAPLSQRAVSQGVLLTNSFNRWGEKSAADLRQSA